MLMEESHFDGVIVGHSVEPETRRVIIPAVRDLHPKIPIVFVYLVAESALADASVDVTAGPRLLMRELQKRVRLG